jgi:hypothetical protein
MSDYLQNLEVCSRSERWRQAHLSHACNEVKLSLCLITRYAKNIWGGGECKTPRYLYLASDLWWVV